MNQGGSPVHRHRLANLTKLAEPIVCLDINTTLNAIVLNVVI